MGQLEETSWDSSSSERSEEKRGSWGSRVSFLLACIGYAVGLGNIWRFPYNVYKSGGGAFLVPYCIMLFLCGIPLLFMELAVGQYTRRGPIGALDKLCPLLKGAGVGTVVISFLLSTYYNVILSWTIFYLGASFQSPLPWTGCNHTWNTDNCFDIMDNFSVSSNSSVPSTQEYFDHRVLQMTDGITDPGSMRFELLLLLVMAWVVVYLCLWRGVALTGKIVYITASVPCFLLVAFAIRGLTLPGADKGLLFFFRPDWSRILEPNIWVNAASQVFNSIGIAFGSLIAFSSYNKFQGPVLRDTIIVTFVDAIVSIVCGVAVFSVLGNLAHEQGKEVKDVVTDGPGLVFVVFPHALSQMPFPQVWSVVFFLMLLCLGIDSQFATVEVIITSLKDGFKTMQDLRHEVLVLIVCAASFIFGIPHVMQGGIYSFTIVDFYSATISLMFIALFETVAIVWCYGAERLANNVQDMTGSRPSVFFTICWKYVAPLLILVIWVFTMTNYTTPSFNSGKYIFPTWCLAIGWLITSLSLVSIPLVALLQIWRTKEKKICNKLKSAFKSRIEDCPCCGGEFDRHGQAHSSRVNLLNNIVNEHNGLNEHNRLTSKQDV